MKNIGILGSTGSIGTQTLEIVREKNEFNIVALSANRNIDLLEKQVREFKPEIVAVFDEKLALMFKVRIKDLDVKIVSGLSGLTEIATYKNVDILVTAVVGMIGLIPTVEAIKNKKTIALANKETLVTAGHIIMPLAKENDVKILPVDSEHSAIFQCLNGRDNNKINKILLTASGGTFRGKSLEDLQNVTVKDALKNPNWNMGTKVTIDSSTLANKGLEVIEAKWLFDVNPRDIEVIIQRESIIHSMVQFDDGFVIANLAVPDMRLPIQYALTYPKREKSISKNLDFYQLEKIHFEKPDTKTFRALDLAYKAITLGGNMPMLFNLYNEIAVEQFIKGEIKYLEIFDFIEKGLNENKLNPNPNIDEILILEKGIRENYL